MAQLLLVAAQEPPDSQAMLFLRFGELGQVLVSAQVVAAADKRPRAEPGRCRLGASMVMELHCSCRTFHGRSMGTGSSGVHSLLDMA